jgi:hypothetical protein
LRSVSVTQLNTLPFEFIDSISTKSEWRLGPKGVTSLRREQTLPTCYKA